MLKYIYLLFALLAFGLVSAKQIDHVGLSIGVETESIASIAPDSVSDYTPPIGGKTEILEAERPSEYVELFNISKDADAEGFKRHVDGNCIVTLASSSVLESLQAAKSGRCTGSLAV